MICIILQEDSDYDSDQDDENFGPHFEEDEAFPDNYKELKKHVTSLRADAILGGGLNLARKYVDLSIILLWQSFHFPIVIGENKNCILKLSVQVVIQ